MTDRRDPAQAIAADLKADLRARREREDRVRTMTEEEAADAEELTLWHELRTRDRMGGQVPRR